MLIIQKQSPDYEIGTRLDYEIRTAKGHCWKFYRAREKASGWENSNLFTAQKYNNEDGTFMVMEAIKCSLIKESTLSL